MFIRGVACGYPYTVEDLLRSATTPGKDAVSPIARAVDTHTRCNEEASIRRARTGEHPRTLVKDILMNCGSTFTKTTKARFGEVVEVVAPDGRGLRFGKRGRFIGLLDLRP